MGGLPLALQVFGSTLLNEPEDGWRWFIDKLKRAPIDDVEENLMISYDALKSVDPNLQDIFLDIACLFIGWKKEEVAKILKTYYMFANRSIDILKKRCLITIDDKDELGMHDLLRDIGIGISRNKSPNEPGKHSRLWDLSAINNVLKQDKGTEAIKAIFAKKSAWFRSDTHELSYAVETFKRMSKLRFLYLSNVNITGSFEHTFENLRWFRWEYCPLKCLPSGFYPKNLVELELPWNNMRTMWELNMVSKVFENLKTLNMSKSRNLTTTPDFTSFPSLETLNLELCQRLEEVHISIGSLVRLVSLNLGSCRNLRSLPDSICSLRALEVLDIGHCDSLEALPTELGKIESLKVLNASTLSVSKLPDSIGRLSNLVKLYLSKNKNLEILPDSICNLRSLELLYISNCGKLEKVPDQLGMITSLRDLRVSGATVLKMLPDISQLSNLKDLDITNCGNLLSIPELPPTLKRIYAVGCNSLKRLPNLSNLKQLEELQFKECWHLLSIPELPPNVKWFKADGCRSMERLPNLSNLKRLERLDLTNCIGLTEIKGLEENNSLTEIIVTNGCRLKEDGCTSMEILPNLSNLKQLKRLVLSDCRCLEILLNLSYLKRLGILDLTNCSGLKQIQGLEELTSMRELYLTGCTSSLLASTLSKRFFQILSGFGHKIEIYFRPAEIPDWIGQSSACGSTMSLDLQPNESHNFLGIIIYFNTFHYGVNYSARNITSGFIWSDIFHHNSGGYGVLVIVPSSIFSIRDGDDRIEITSELEIIYGVHLLYKTKITMMSEYDGTTDNVEEERCYPSKRLKHVETDN